MKLRTKLMTFLVAVLWIGASATAAQQPVPKPAADESRAQPRTLRMIDLRDRLLVDAMIPDFAPVEAGVLTGGDGLHGLTSAEFSSARAAYMQERLRLLRDGDLDEAGKIAARAERWQEMLRLWIEPPLSPELDRLDLLANGTLVAQLPAEGHAWLERFFVLQLGERPKFTSEFKILVGPKGCFDSLLPVGTSFLAQKEVERLVTAAQDQAGTELLSAPTLTLFTRSRGYVSTYDTVEYVKDWRLRTVEPGHRKIAVPTIGSARDGLGVSVRCVEIDLNRLGVEVELSRSMLKQPIRTAKVRLDVDGGKDFELALPEVDSQKLRSHLVVEPGRSVYFRGPAQSEAHETIVLLTVSRGEQAPGKKD